MVYEDHRSSQSFICPALMSTLRHDEYFENLPLRAFLVTVYIFRASQAAVMKTIELQQLSEKVDKYFKLAVNE